MSVVTDTTLEAPFLGLRYFDEEQSHLFFGREAQANDILEKLRRSRLVTVMGSSGSGKSSLVRAGVVPGLKAGFLGDAGPRWRIAKMRPGGSPISNLGRELEKALSVPGLEVTLRRGPLGLVQAVEECRLPTRENVLVIADQFEELFRYQREADHTETAKEEAAAFVKLLLEATNQRALPIYVIVTMRSDYLGSCAQFRDLPERINDGLYLVPRMRRDQLEQAISGPVAVEDTAIAARLVQKLLNDTGDDPDQLPVLQHALLRAWNAWNHAARPLDLEDLDAVGGMKESLSRHADEIFEGLSAEQRRIARVIFQQLSDRDTDGREIRRPAPVTHIASVAGATVHAVEEIVAKFAAPDAALLYRNEDGHLDISHESLIRKWRLIQGAKPHGGAAAQGWMQAEVDARDQFEVLVERARKKDLLIGRALEDALSWRALGLNDDWAKRYAITTGSDTGLQDVLVFIEECRKKEVEEVRGRRRRNRIVFSGVVVFIVVIIAMWRSAVHEKNSARVALSQARTQEASRLVGTNQPGEALAHLAQTLRSDPDSLAARSWISDLVFNERVWVPGVPLQHQDRVNATAFSPDGRRVVTVSDVVTVSKDGTARVWDAATGQLVSTPLQYKDNVHAAAFSPDGRSIVTASNDGTARIWDAATGALISASLRHEGRVNTAVFGLDGRHIVTASNDGTARIWDAATGQSAGPTLEHKSAIVHSAAFSPDGRRVVTASRSADSRGFTSGGVVRIWDAATGQLVWASFEHTSSVVLAAFSPDGRYVVSASVDDAFVWDAATGQSVGTLHHPANVTMAAFSVESSRVVTACYDGIARVWDVTTSRSFAPIQHGGSLYAAAFSPDGSRVVTASSNNTARVWDAVTSEPIGAPLQHRDQVEAAAFSPDGRRVVTGSRDKTARVWDAAIAPSAPAPLQHKSDIRTVVFSPDGRRVATASSDKTARVWDATTGQPVGAAMQHPDMVAAAAFSPDGRRVVTVSRSVDSRGFASDGIARIWDAATGQPVGAALQHPDVIWTAAFSPDGLRVVTASSDKTARIWDAATSLPIGAPLRHEGPAVAGAFSPDGRRVVTASSDKTARIWDAATSLPVGAPLRHEGPVVAAAFSPDGLRVVTAANDSTARIWDAVTGRPVSAPLQHREIVWASFSSDGRRVVTASGDGTAQVWDAASGQPIGRPLQHESQVTAAAFSPDGLRVVTASWDSTARVWDAATGQPVGAPLRHRTMVKAAAFSPDGRYVVTASNDTARVWQVLLDLSSGERVQLLADLAEVVGGYRVTDMGSVVPLQELERLQRLRRLAGPGATAFAPVDVLLRRFLDPRR